MSVPNLLHVVEEVYARGWDFTTKAGLCAYSDAVVSALHATDQRFGHLTKAEGQTHCVDAQGRRHAVDVAFFKDTGQVIDFIISAGFGTPPPPNTPSWHEGPDGEYPPEQWFAPGGTVPPPDPEPPPDDELEARVTALEADVRALGVRVTQQAADLDAYRQRMEAINENAVHPPLPPYIGRLFGFTIRSYPE